MVKQPLLSETLFGGNPGKKPEVINTAVRRGRGEITALVGLLMDFFEIQCG